MSVMDIIEKNHHFPDQNANFGDQKIWQPDWLDARDATLVTLE